MSRKSFETSFMLEYLLRYSRDRIFPSIVST
jgi:hypothetical protein